MIARAPIPAPSPTRFATSIVHPDLWLWDSWTATCGPITDLYCLALARRDTNGAPISPASRNDFSFHVRRFRTVDDGGHWTDEGCAFAPSDGCDGAFARNVWSGSALDLPDGRRLHALTGLRQVGPDCNFLQTIFLASAHSATEAPEPQDALLCPARDYERIRKAGYYLGARDALGADEGEEGGPILAWRDPFLMFDSNGGVNLFWSAKAGPRTPAIGRAKIAERAGVWRLVEVFAPIALPTGKAITQAEVPKIYRRSDLRGFWLMISASDRISEAQSTDDVSKQLRFFTSSTLEGPWRPYCFDESVLVGQHVFGASVLKGDLDSGRLTLIAPVTEQAHAPEQLTIKTLRVRCEAPAPAECED